MRTRYDFLWALTLNRASEIEKYSSEKVLYSLPVVKFQISLPDQLVQAPISQIVLSLSIILTCEKIVKLKTTSGLKFFFYEIGA